MTSTFLYNISLAFYQAVLFIVAPFNKKAKLLVQGRRESWKKIESFKKDHASKSAWFHCASLGEFEQARPIIEAYKSRFTSHKIILTFFSPSGYEIRKNYSLADLVCYLPSDSKKNARKLIHNFQPDVAFFIKYEFWFYYLSELKNRAIPVYSLSAIFRPNHHIFGLFGNITRKAVRNFTHIFTQDHKSKSLLQSIDINNTTVAGDTRFDRVKYIHDESKDIPNLEKFNASHKVMVIGSCWNEDLELLIPFINSDHHKLNFILAPHEIDEYQLSSIERSIQLQTVRYSKATSELINQSRVIIIDSIGLLNKLYKYGHYAYIGGAFGKGLHNILEPAAFGLPVFFGDKNYLKFREAMELIERKCAFPVKDLNALVNQYNRIKEDTYRIKLSNEIKEYVIKNAGATEIIMNYCFGK